MNRENGFAALREALAQMKDPQETHGVRLRIGTVLKTEPLEIDVCGTRQEAAHFYICHRLLQGQVERRNVKGSLAISASCPNGSHSSMIVSSGVLTATVAEGILKKDDLVLLLTDDDQTFFLMDKVVHL